MGCRVGLAMSMFRKRPLECALAGVLLGMGLWLAAPMESMDTPAYLVLNIMATEMLWAWLFIAGGLVHAAWLAINGRRWWSPIARLASCGYSTFLYGTWAAGFAFYDSITTVVMGYGSWAVLSLACAVTAWHDAIYSMRVHYAASAA